MQYLDLEARILSMGVTGPAYTHFFQQVTIFREQLDATFVPADIQRVLDVLLLMIELHMNQSPRPDGSPYIEHPLAVASQVLEAMAQKDLDLVNAALLHDAVEDQAAKLAQKRRECPAGEVKSEQQLALDVLEQYTQSIRVRNIVAGLTNPDFSTILEEQGIKKGVDETTQALYISAKQALYVAHIREVIGDPDVALIKLFDCAANALHLHTISDSQRREKLLRKYAPVIDIMIERLTDTVHPLNLTPQAREHILSRFVEARHTMVQRQKYLDL